MCYMEERRIGVRELRQNLTKYLRRVQRGERLEVTERGKPVAVLAPLGEPESPLARLVSAGRGIPPRADLLEVIPPKGPTSTRTSDALRDERADRL
jgi:prevent-host-death family protein